jgi:aryl-alcohol dehydrogenase-like predicted oxidoreductase
MPEERSMEKRILGRSGIEVSPMGMGCWAIGGPWSIVQDGEPLPAGWGQVDDVESIRSIHRALDLGITFFDTAANYGCGHSERILGQAISDRRDQVVIATKFGHIIDEQTKVMHGDDALVVGNIRTDCEASLRRLNTDYIDLYQFHEGQFDLCRSGAGLLRRTELRLSTAPPQCVFRCA